MKGEVDLGKPHWIPKPPAVNLQGLASFDHRKLTRRLGSLNASQMAEIKSVLRELLGLCGRVNLTKFRVRTVTARLRSLCAFPVLRVFHWQKAPL
jgi:hypothetical protein